MNIGYNDDMKGIKTDSFTFEDFVKNDDILYVDKTEYAYSLVSNKPDKRFFFVSRPRRYGKSLFCSMLHAIFDGRKELFRDLYIGKTDYPFEKYPVLHFDFSGMNMRTADTFLNVFRSYIRYQAERNGIELLSDSPSAMLDELIIKLSDEKGPVVILIDEFDAPFTSGSAEKDIQDTARREFNAFYATIKKHGSRIRFFFITGVVKLANLSIFSAMNNLTDLSMLPEFASAFGYTEEELEEYFGEGIDEYVEAHPDVERNDFVQKIKAYYNGYRFSPRSEVTVYNPVSVGTFFNQGCYFQNYWDMTGVPKFAVDLAVNYNLAPSIMGGEITLNVSSFINFDISQLSEGGLSTAAAIALLYFAGYLTIKSVSEIDNEVYYLGYPNREVKRSFTENLLARYTGYSRFRSTWLLRFQEACYAGDDKSVEESLRDYYAHFSYDFFPKGKEKNFHIALDSIFTVMSIPAWSEVKGLTGRADEVVMAGKHFWIFELKVDGSADVALKQIDEKAYAEHFATLRGNGIAIHKVGFSISSETRMITDWKHILT